MIWLLACSLPVKERQSVEVVSLLETGDLFTLRIGQSNTGIFSNQSTLRGHFWKRKQSPLSISSRGTEADSQWHSDIYSVGPSHLKRESNQWTAQVNSEGFTIKWQSDLGAKGCVFSSKDWHSNVPLLHGESTGWLQVERNSAPLFGQTAIIEHRGSRTSASESKWLIAQSTDISIYYEEWGEFSYGCALIKGTAQEIDASDVLWTNGGALISLGEWSAEFSFVSLYGIEDPYDHISNVERALVGSIFPTPQIHWIQARAAITGDERYFIPAILRYQGQAPPSLFKKRGQK